MLIESLSGFPAFALYFMMGLLYLLIFMGVYVFITGHDEYRLLKEGNVTVAVAFGGSLIGYALPLSSAIRFASSPLDCAVWATVSFITQIIAYYLCALLLPKLTEKLEKNTLAHGVFVACVSITIGIISLSSMSLPVK